MVNELDFVEEENMFFQVRGNHLQKIFTQKSIDCQLLEIGGVKPFIEKFIEDRPYIKNIAFSDGVTLYQLGLFDWVKEKYKHLEVNEPLERGKTGHFAIFGEQPEGRMHLPYEEWKVKTDAWYDNVRASLLSDLLIISANAITMNGEIISVDGLGNRVAGMIFGPRHVLCIVGRNKIFPNEEAARSHIQNYVAPKTYIRHLKKHAATFQDLPCVKNGKCFNCSHMYSSCRNLVIVRGQIKQHSDRIHLLVVNEDLGF